MKMMIAIVVLALASLISAQNVTVGYARVRGTTADAGIIGSATFTMTDANVTIALNISGITNNLGANHGVHIHAFGDLSSGNGTSVGGHWNAFSMPHGCPELSGDTRHIGDTGNWMVAPDGTLVGTKTLDIMTLMGTDSSIIGFAIVIHNGTDNCINETSSGARLAWGVIGVANPANYAGTQNLATPIANYAANTGATQAICVLTPAASQGTGAPGVTGTVFFTQQADGSVQVSARVFGLVDTKPRGFHIHQWGDLSSTDATSAGSHYTGAYYNSSQPHGIPAAGSDRPHHVGDMGNLYNYDVNGTGMYYGVYDFFRIYSGSSGIPSIIGRAVVVHNNTDDCTGATGNAGPRIAYCVIGPANPTFGGALTPLTSVDSSQNATNCPSLSSTSGAMMATTGAMGSSSSTSSSSGSSPAATSSTSAAFAVSACFAIVIAALFA